MCSLEFSTPAFPGLWPLPPASAAIIPPLSRPSFYRVHSDCIRPTQIIWDNITILRSLITSAKFLLPCMVTYSQVLGIVMWTPLWGHYSASHTCLVISWIFLTLLCDVTPYLWLQNPELAAAHSSGEFVPLLLPDALIRGCRLLFLSQTQRSGTCRMKHHEDREPCLIYLPLSPMPRTAPPET